MTRGAGRRLVLAVQRLLTHAPAPLRSAARRLLGARLGARLETEAAVDGWQTGLLGAAAAVPLRWPDAPPTHTASPAQTAPPGPATTGTPLRCLLVTDSLDVSGMDEFVAFLARRLRGHGVHTAVMIGSDVAGRGFGRLARDLVAEGIEVVDPGRAGGAAWMRRWRPDVLSAHGCADWPLETAADLGIPAVETLHGMHNLFGASPERVVARRHLLAALVSVSEMVRLQYLALDGGLEPDRIITIPNGVDARRLPAVSRERARAALGLADEFLFVSLARHSLQKNGYALASAFDEMAAAVPGAHLLICGRSDDRSYTGQVLALKRRLAHGDRLHLRDNTPHVAALLAAADGFALDSFFEGWSLSSMEALASGVPVVMSDVGGAREQLSGGVAKGALVANPLGDPLAVDWTAIGAARFRPQPNRAELVAALTALATGAMPVDARETIAADSLARFDDALCLARHAHALAAAANGRPPALPRGLLAAADPIEGANDVG